MKTHASSLFSAAGIIAIMAFFVIEGCFTLLKPDERLPLPLTFGNFRHVRALLEMSPPRDDFSFAVAGDIQGSGTFQRIVRELRREKPDFAVLLGNCVRRGTEAEHRYFQTMMRTGYALPFPVFYVLGNRDVSRERFPLERFEAAYGPSIFSFEYGRCLFIVLRTMEAPASNPESIEFLRKLSQLDMNVYHRRFVFMHIPPVASGDIQVRRISEEGEFRRLFEKLRIDCVFTGDYHGYARIMEGSTGYLVTGGGGSRLDVGRGRQFHHAVMVRVKEGTVSERIIPVDDHLDPKVVLMRFAIVMFLPWVSSHAMEAMGVNALASMGLLLLFVHMNRLRPPDG